VRDLAVLKGEYYPKAAPLIDIRMFMDNFVVGMETE
jgi:hypothetical protein